MSDRVLEMKVDGMTCGKCSGRVQKAIEALPGVRSAKVDHVSGSAEIRTAGSGPGEDEIKEAVRKAGYQPR